MAAIELYKNFSEFKIIKLSYKQLVSKFQIWDLSINKIKNRMYIGYICGKIHVKV